MSKYLLLIIVITFIAFANSLLSDFVYDDYVVIVNNDFIKSWKNTGLMFSQRYLSHPMEIAFNEGAYNVGSGEATYRPIATLSYFLNYHFFKLVPWKYKLTNILLHISNAILAFLLLNILFNNYILSFFSAIFFSVNPVNLEVINCTALRPNVLAYTFSVLSIILYFKFKAKSYKQRWLYLSGSLVSSLLAVFSKEIAVVLPLGLIVCDIFYEKFDFKRIFSSIRIYSLYFLIDVFYLLVFFFVFPPQQMVLEKWRIHENLFRMFNVLGIYLKDILLPIGLVPIELGYLIPPISFWRIIFAVCFTSLCVYIIFKKTRKVPEVSFSIIWFFIWLLPVNNFLYTLRITAAHRYLYIPILGFSIVLSSVLIKIWDRKSGWLPNLFVFRRALIFSMITYFIIFTISGNIIWKNNLFLNSFVAEKYPFSSAAHISLGITYTNFGNYEDAKKEFNMVLSQDSIALNPFDLANAYLYLGKIYIAETKLKEAEEVYSKALKLFPNSARIHTELGILYGQKGLYEKSLEYFNKAKDINPSFTPAYINSGISYINMHDYLKAKNEFFKALDIYPESKEAKYGIRLIESTYGKEVE